VQLSAANVIGRSPSRSESEDKKIAKRLDKGSVFPAQAFSFPRRVSGVGDVASALGEFLADRQHECLIVMHLSEKLEPLQFTCHRGDRWHTPLPTKKIFADVVELGSKGIILAHNHPSGGSQPSESDLRATRIVAEVCEHLDVSLLDHLIFGRDHWTSLRQKGFI
jgi:DNA repair protein RadC